MNNEAKPAKPLTANQIKAAEIVAQLKPGTVVTSPWGTSTVKELKGKSVYFTDGKYEPMRGMFHYKIVSA